MNTVIYINSYSLFLHYFNYMYIIYWVIIWHVLSWFNMRFCISKSRKRLKNYNRTKIMDKILIAGHHYYEDLYISFIKISSIV